ncbi:MarR family transcriptional regulator [Actinoplanes sp. OR16]|uniref:MarR family winged helix-turn-helix transcriptional regulator n=1 Tax=Actinoplanes sp. OR16 TaxID=946334 RepID=UPI000F6D0CD6|nr:MarR family winged helix-turn-helix transcriptional regulator [Actinoplanes sp. OR16]BBH68052.1 MarR family transcriptional regulator [Actinoplanes sp. OR16]
MTDRTDVPWLTDDERHAWMALNAMFATLPPAIDSQLKRDAGINFFEYQILSWLSMTPERVVRMGILAHLAGGSISRLSHAVTRLERQGWVRRRTSDSTEGRCVEAELTDAGMALVVAAAPDHVREARRLVFDVLTGDEVDQLKRIGRKLSEAASPQSAACFQD